MKGLKSIATAAAVFGVFWLWGAGLKQQAAQQHAHRPAATHSAPAKTTH